jgi:hypothetical protein
VYPWPAWQEIFNTLLIARQGAGSLGSLFPGQFWHYVFIQFLGQIMGKPHQGKLAQHVFCLALPGQITI